MDKGNRITLYDPPAGWKYGFPKIYAPRDGDTIIDTLIRDGYPVEEIFHGMADHIRYFTHEEPEPRS